MKVENKALLKSEQGDPKVIDQCSTEKTSGTFDRSTLPDTIIIHYTGSTTAESAIRTLTDPRVKASAHLVVDLDGTVTQLVPFSHVAWHAGVSSYGDRNGINKYSIGIEIVNPGYLNQTEDGKFYTAYGQEVSASKAEKRKHKNESTERYWHIYTNEQIVCVEEICQAIKEVFPIHYLLGHDEISPHRKVDPGPCFPIDKFRSKILDLRSQDKDDLIETGVVMVDNLNIRSDANMSATKVALPLKKDTIVRILESKEGWYRVKTEMEGWVYGKYIS